jgi:hypothetical protein
LVLELRDFVLKNAPEVEEAIKFHSLCYYKPDQPYGAIGGSVCMITPREECVLLSFIHGAALPDPEGLLQGHAKAKRYIAIHRRTELSRPAIRRFLRAAVEYTPDKPDPRR